MSNYNNQIKNTFSPFPGYWVVHIPPYNTPYLYDPVSGIWRQLYIVLPVSPTHQMTFYRQHQQYQQVLMPPQAVQQYQLAPQVPRITQVPKKYSIPSILQRTVPFVPERTIPQAITYPPNNLMLQHSSQSQIYHAPQNQLIFKTNNQSVNKLEKQQGQNDSKIQVSKKDRQSPNKDLDGVQYKKRKIEVYQDNQTNKISIQSIQIPTGLNNSSNQLIDQQQKDDKKVSKKNEDKQNIFKRNVEKQEGEISKTQENKNKSLMCINQSQRTIGTRSVIRNQTVGLVNQNQPIRQQNTPIQLKLPSGFIQNKQLSKPHINQTQSQEAYKSNLKDKSRKQ